MNVLFLSFDGVTDPLGRSQILPYLFGLRDQGHEISIISLEKASEQEINRFKEELREQKGIKLFPGRFQSWPKGISYLINSNRVKKQFRKALREEDIQIIHSRSVVPLSVISNLVPKKMKVIFDMRGFWADERIDGGIWKKENPLFRRAYKKFKREERYWIQRSDSIITLTHAAKNEIMHWSQTGFQEGTLRSFVFSESIEPAEIDKKTKVIPTCVNTSHFNPKRFSNHQTSEQRQKIGIPDGDLVFGYLGSLGTWYLFEEMLSFFLSALGSYPNCSWLIITREKPENIIDRIKASIKDEEKSRRILKKIFIQGADYDQVPQMVNATDIGLYFISTSFSKIASSATKTGEFLSMGKPVITNSGWGDMEDLAKKYPKYIYLSDQIDFEAMGDTFNQSSLNSKKSEIRQVAEIELSLGSGITEYNEIYNQLGH